VSFIASYCRIKNGSVSINGKNIFFGNSNLETLATALYEHLKIDYPKFYKMDKQSKFGVLAAELVLANFKIDDPYAASVILSNSAASLDTDIHYQQASAKAPSPAVFVYTLPNIVAGEICIRHGIKGESNFFVTPEYDPYFLSSYLRTLMTGNITTALTGWIEVLGEKADVFLYLVTKHKTGLGLEHTSQNLKELYQ
jgi:hypothetical protein